MKHHFRDKYHDDVQNTDRLVTLFSCLGYYSGGDLSLF